MSYILIERTMPLSTTTDGVTSPTSIKGQSFTVPTNAGLSTGTYKLKILTSSIGGVNPGSQLTNGIQGTRLKLRDFANNDETNSSTNCFSGTLLATSGYGSITGNAPAGDPRYPESTFIFDTPVELTVGTKYVIEIDLDSSVAVYYMNNNPYSDGRAYEVPNVVISQNNDFAFRIEGILMYKPLTLTNFVNAIKYYFGETTTLPGGTNATSNTVMDIANWNTSSITNMSNAFSNRTSFNVDLNSWDTSNVTDIRNMFSGATSFNNGGNTLIWDLTSVTKISNMFNGATALTVDLSFNFSNSVTSIDMRNIFQGAINFNGDITGWDVTKAHNMSNIFNGATSFNQNLSSWSVYNVTDMRNMFFDASSYNNGGQALDWSASSLSATTVSSMFEKATSFNQDVSNWNVTSIHDFRKMFKGATNFDQNIRGWNVTTTNNLTTGMFMNSAIVSNPNYQYIPNGWVGSIANGSPNNSIFFSNVAAMPPFIPLSNSHFIQGLNYYFDSGTTQPLPPSSTYATASNVGKQSDSTTKDAIETWNTQNVTDMTNAFQNKTTFNQDLSGWVVEQVEKMQGMFLGASSFNNGETGNTMSNPLDWSLNSLHDTISTTPYALQGMFQGASSFNQRLGCSNWDVSNCSTFSYMFDGCNKLSDEALVGINTWNTQNVRDIRNMFTNCNDPSFISPGLSDWNTNYLDSGNGLTQVFKGATYFNENISTKPSSDNTHIAWNTINVTKFPETFKDATAFNNGDISGGSDASLNWYINGSLNSMFDGASSFNQDVRTENVILSVDNPLVSTLIDPSDASHYITGVSDMSFSEAIRTSIPQQPESDYFTRITLSFKDNFGEQASLYVYKKAYTGGLDSYQLLQDYTTNFEKKPITEIIFKKPTSLIPRSTSQSVFDLKLEVKNPNGWITNDINIPSYKIDTLKSYSNYQAWNVSNTQDFGSMFKNAAIFNRPLYTWNTESALNMSHMFDGASSFNQDLNTLNYPDTGSYTSWKMNTVTDIKFMFKDASSFDNGDNQTFTWILDSISGDSIRGLFKGASSFNKNLNSFPQLNTSSNSWDLSGVTHFNEVFAGASSFNNGIPNVGITSDFIAQFNWQTGRAVDMSGMFQDATMFTQNVNNWFGSGKLEDMSNAQVSGSTNGLRGMFSGAIKFVAGARVWNIPDNIDFTDIFKGATDMSSIYYLRRNETGYDDTPDINFFNYSNQVVVKNISYQNYYDSSLALTVIPASVNNIENGQVRLPYNLLFSTQQNFTVADGLTFNMAANVDSFDVVSGVNIDVFYTPINDNEKIFIESTIDFIWKNNVVISVPLQVYVDYGLVIVPTPPDPIPNPDVTPPPPQKSGREYACSNKKRHGCEAYMANSDKNGGLFSGNINQPNFMAVEAYKYSNLVNFSSRRQSMKTKYIPLQLNVFGKYQGAPGGSGMRLKNKF